jgi:hypothetical protein
MAERKRTPLRRPGLVLRMGLRPVYQTGDLLGVN